VINPTIIFSLVLTFAAVASGQQTTVPQNSDERAMGERDPEKENQVAKLFESIRANAKIPRLGRIRDRDSLEQQVCSIALTDAPPERSSTEIFAFYKTTKPEVVTPELNKVASFNRLHPKYNPSFARYSVAVWRMKSSQTGSETYWVGVHLYWSAAVEFFDYHFTDDIYYHNDWKKTVAAPCRSK
jgi:hypothetical protein